MPAHQFRRDDGNALELVVLAFEAPHAAVGIQRQARVGWPRADFPQQLGGSAEDLGFAAGADVRRRQHDFPVGATDGFDQIVVFLFVCGVREFHVHRDRLRACLAKVVDDLGVVLARQRRASVEVVFFEFFFRFEADRHEHDVRGRLASAADRVALVDRLQFGASQQLRGVGGDADAAGECRDDQQRHGLASLPACAAHPNAPISACACPLARRCYRASSSRCPLRGPGARRTPSWRRRVGFALDVACRARNGAN